MGRGGAVGRQRAFESDKAEPDLSEREEGHISPDLFLRVSSRHERGLSRSKNRAAFPAEELDSAVVAGHAGGTNRGQVMFRHGTTSSRLGHAQRDCRFVRPERQEFLALPVKAQPAASSHRNDQWDNGVLQMFEVLIASAAEDTGAIAGEGDRLPPTDRSVRDERLVCREEGLDSKFASRSKPESRAHDCRPLHRKRRRLSHPAGLAGRPPKRRFRAGGSAEPCTPDTRRRFVGSPRVARAARGEFAPRRTDTRTLRLRR